MKSITQNITKFDRSKLVSVLNSVGDAIIICDLEGNIDFVNVEACEILDKEFKSIIGHSLNQVMIIQNDLLNCPSFFFSDTGEHPYLEKGLFKESYIQTGLSDKKYISAKFTRILEPDREVTGYVLVFRDVSKIHIAELEVLRERNNLMQLFSSLPVGMAIIDEGLLILGVNPQFRKTFGVSNHDITGSRLGSIVRCTNSLKMGCGRAEVCAGCELNQFLVRNIEKGETLNGHVVSLTTASNNVDKVFYFNINFMPLDQGNKRVYMITFEDITPRILYEKNLEKAKLINLSYLNGLPLIIYKLDERLDCEFVNDAFKQWQNGDQLQFFEILQLRMNDNHFNFFKSAIEVSSRNRTDFQLELVMKNQFSIDRHMLAIGKPYYDSENQYKGIIGILLDRHDGFLTEEKFRQSQKKYYSLFQNMDHMIFYVQLDFYEDGQVKDGRIMEINKKVYTTLKRKPHEILRSDLRQLSRFLSIEFESFRERIEKVVTYKNVDHIEEHYLAGINKWIQLSLYSPEPGYVVLLVTDIDYKKRASIELYQEKEKSEAANKAKSEFLANMSHEIRTPLNGIVGMIDLTLLDPVNEEQKDNLLTAKECVATLIEIINDVLDFSKIEAGKLKIEYNPFLMKAFVDTIVKLHQPHIHEKGLEHRLEIDEILNNYYYGDENRLKQIVNNLINNAIKFTDKGTITLQIKESEGTDGENKSLEFSVIDTGIGIEESKFSMLFNSFTQVDGTYTRKYGGTGLGLVISKQLAEMMFGTISFNSVYLKGSKFTLTLPLREVDSITDEKTVEKQRRIELKDKEILLVEDDSVNQIVMSKMIELEKIKVCVVSNGLEAIEAVKLKKYDLILMDIQMPQMNGIEATKWIRNELNLNQKSTIIALTAYALEGDEALFRASGMDGYISKPVDRNTLVAFLSKYLNEETISTKDTSQFEMSVITTELYDLVTEKLIQIEMALMQDNYILLELSAHQLKMIFENHRIEELKTLAFKMELSIRKELYNEALDYIKKIRLIIGILMDGGQANEKNINS
ncbi:MAG: hypothetical protein BGO41_00040 [Clostridiales bacterium 38-18]|nr:MAG: hypothetical protein BGO41_00040 [Clostridiales bacterium 38-18]